MPRQPRSWIPDAGAHAISRFVDRRFHLVDDEDRRAFLRGIAHADRRWDWTWLSYAIMSSHVHYGHIAGTVDPDRFFRSAHTRFAHYYHRRVPEVTLGPVFADRPALHVVGRTMLTRMVAYHHRNPVTAGIVARPRDSTWTSHRAYLRLEPSPPWLDVERALDILGFRDNEAGRRRFDDFVTEVDLAPMRRVAKTQEREEPTRIRTRTADADWSRLLFHARDVVGLPPSSPLQPRSRSGTLVRRLVALFATIDLGQSYATVARQLGITTGGVYNLVNRGDPTVVPMLDELRRRWCGGQGENDLARSA